MLQFHQDYDFMLWLFGKSKSSLIFYLCTFQKECLKYFDLYKKRFVFTVQLTEENRLEFLSMLCFHKRF